MVEKKEHRMKEDGIIEKDKPKDVSGLAKLTSTAHDTKSIN